MLVLILLSGSVGWAQVAPPASAPEAAQLPHTGDIYVLGDRGASIYLDGVDTGQVVPSMVRTIQPGQHVVRVDLQCRTATATVDLRARAVERVELRPEPGGGSVAVRSIPSGATVVVNGQELGTTPLAGATVPCGTHEIAVHSAGRVPQTRSLTVSLHDKIELEFDLPRNALGALAITVDPLEAEVLVDGEPRGAGPLTVDELPVGAHQIEARLAGYAPAAATAAVVEEEIRRVDLVLAPLPAREPLQRRLGLDRQPWGRITLNASMTILSGGLAYAAHRSRQTAVGNYATYENMSYDQDHKNFYADEVLRPWTNSQVMGGMAIAGIATSAVLWATTGFGQSNLSAGSAPLVPVLATGRF